MRSSNVSPPRRPRWRPFAPGCSGAGCDRATSPRTAKFIEVTGTAAAVEQTFSVRLGLYAIHGRSLRAADRPLSVPAELAPMISGVIGVDQALQLVHPLGIGPDPDAPRHGTRVVGPAPGFRNAPPCADHYGERSDGASPPFGGYPRPVPVAPCGYTPPRLR